MPLAQITGMDKIGWNGPFEELWCVDSRGNVVILNDKGEILSHRTEKITCMKSLNSHLWLTDDGGILRDASCEVSAEMACEWQGRIRLPIPAREVIWELLGRARALNVKIEGDRGADASQTIANYAVTGLINRPMRMLLRGPARRYLTMGVTGTMMTGGRLGEIRLKI